jgi:D-alanine-D-alanine ligase-like ATP-grasp enzyme
MNVLVTSAGAPCAENVIQSLKLATPTKVVGIDVDRDMLLLSSADEKAVVHHPSEYRAAYVDEVNRLVRRHRCSLMIPVSDREIYVAALHRSLLPPMVLPSLKVVALCRDKLELQQFLNAHDIATAPFQLLGTYHQRHRVTLPYPLWMRATVGAGGYLAHRVASQDDVDALLHLYRRKSRRFMLTKYLQGRNFCHTSLWRDGELVFSVVKERLQWVYRRIGTTAMQRVVHDAHVNDVCEDAIIHIATHLDPSLTGLMMVDLKADEAGRPYITEINAGRTGTVSVWFALASQAIYGDARANFWHQLTRIHRKQSCLDAPIRDALPDGLTFMRHIDMSHLLLLNGDPLVRLKRVPQFKLENDASLPVVWMKGAQPP